MHTLAKLQSLVVASTELADGPHAGIHRECVDALVSIVELILDIVEWRTQDSKHNHTANRLGKAKMSERREKGKEEGTKKRQDC